jgi:hypothetical protein
VKQRKKAAGKRGKEKAQDENVASGLLFFAWLRHLQLALVSVK